MAKKIPGPSIVRLNLLYSLLEKKLANGEQTIYSSDIGRELGIAPHSIRKDISYLGEIGKTNAGYDVQKLRDHIFTNLGLNRPMQVCIVGLGRLGSALLNYEPFSSSGYTLAAGFDTNINTLEILKTRVPLYPAYEITEVVQYKKIELAVIAVPASAAQEVAELLMAGGIKAILNFAPVVIRSGSPDLMIQNIDFLGELRLLTALLSLQQQAP